MSRDDALTNLLNLMVLHYPDPASGRDVAEKAGLSTRFIPFGGNLDNVWMSVLREARKSETGLRDIARVAQKDYPNIDFLTLAQQINENAFKGPKLEEPDWKGPPKVDEGLEKLIGEQPSIPPPSASWRSASELYPHLIIDRSTHSN